MALMYVWHPHRMDLRTVFLQIVAATMAIRGIRNISESIGLSYTMVIRVPEEKNQEEINQ
ncbi:hypothetical protein AVEN_207015-1, partial [Araneus ventricosus]